MPDSVKFFLAYLETYILLQGKDLHQMICKCHM